MLARIALTAAPDQASVTSPSADVGAVSVRVKSDLDPFGVGLPPLGGRAETVYIEEGHRDVVGLGIRYCFVDGGFQEQGFLSHRKDRPRKSCGLVVLVIVLDRCHDGRTFLRQPVGGNDETVRMIDLIVGARDDLDVSQVGRRSGGRLSFSCGGRLGVGCGRRLSFSCGGRLDCGCGGFLAHTLSSVANQGSLD